MVISPPTYEESCKVHETLMEIKKLKPDQTKPVTIESTLQKTTLLMHTEDKNLHGKIFGGYVLRLAFELGWLCVYKYLKGRIPTVTNIDDVQFLAPV